MTKKFSMNEKFGQHIPVNNQMKYRTTTKNTIDKPNTFCMNIILLAARKRISDCLLFCEYKTTLIEKRGDG